jgi:hypothetical protein
MTNTRVTFAAALAFSVPSFVSNIRTIRLGQRMEMRRIGAKMIVMVEEARERRRVAEVFGVWKMRKGG